MEGYGKRAYAYLLIRNLSVWREGLLGTQDDDDTEVVGSTRSVLESCYFGAVRLFPGLVYYSVGILRTHDLMIMGYRGQPCQNIEGRIRPSLGSGRKRYCFLQKKVPNMSRR